MTWLGRGTSYHLCVDPWCVWLCRSCGGAGQEVAVPELSESIKIAVLKGTLSHLLDQEVRPPEPHELHSSTACLTTYTLMCCDATSAAVLCSSCCFARRYTGELPVGGSSGRGHGPAGVDQPHADLGQRRRPRQHHQGTQHTLLTKMSTHHTRKRFCVLKVSCSQGSQESKARMLTLPIPLSCVSVCLSRWSMSWTAC